MLIVFGERNYGSVDRCPGFGHVETRFTHIQFLPILPMGSYFVPEADASVAIKIPLSAKSIFVAWARAGLVLLIAVAALLGVAEWSDGSKTNAVNAWIVTATLYLVFDLLRLCPGIGRATDRRADQLRAAVGAIVEDERPPMAA